MNTVYMLRHRPHTHHSDDDDIIVGTYTDADNAVEIGRKLMMHDDDEYMIVMHLLNCLHPGDAIWSRDADKGKEWALAAYTRHWPKGMPTYGEPKA